ncbi:MAG: serine/threonine protein kinase [Planctomycetota bacterium]|nr:MAG: serine/threonine protein kinase [Planctomycetota bacterium]
MLDEAAFGAALTVRAAAPALKSGDEFHGLRIEELLGRGGMGFVYAARHLHLERRVALKVVAPELASDPEFVERFKREARALAALSHPAIVAVHDFGFERDLPFLVMEFVDGTTLRTLIAKKALPPEEALRIVPQLCEALEYAHDRGVVHRDIKPENILIGRDGKVKIADFGLAKLKSGDRLTQTSAVMGTPHYMAPEQVESTRGVDHRADIYSMGVVIYEMLTGELPIGRFPLPSKSPGVDARLDEIVMKALEKSPELRFQRASEFGEAISRLVPSAAGQPAAAAVAVGGAPSLAIATPRPVTLAPPSATIPSPAPQPPRVLSSSIWNWIGLGWLRLDVIGLFVMCGAIFATFQSAVSAEAGHGWPAVFGAVVFARLAHLEIERLVVNRARIGFAACVLCAGLALGIVVGVHGFYEDTRWERLCVRSTHISKNYDRDAVDSAMGKADLVTPYKSEISTEDRSGEIWWYGRRSLAESLRVTSPGDRNSFATEGKTIKVYFSKEGSVLAVAFKSE